MSGNITLSDAIGVLQHLFNGGYHAPCREAADADDNGRLDLADAVVTLQFLFASGRPPMPPFPQCGVDETPDELDCKDSSCAYGQD